MQMTQGLLVLVAIALVRMHNANDYHVQDRFAHALRVCKD